MASSSGSGEKFSPSGLVLDMDGLMVDSEPVWFEVERAFAAARGGTFTAEHAHACVGRGTPYTLSFMTRTFGFATDVEADTRAIMDAFLERVGDLREKPGLFELIAAAEGVVPIAVASSSPMRLIRAVMARFDLTRRITALVSGEQVASPKPAPDIFLKAAHDIGVPPERCVVMEDSLAGATAGRAAGMFVIAVPERQHHEEGFARVADRVVSNLVAARDAIELPVRAHES